MPQITSVAPQFSATRSGGEHVEILGSELDQVTSVGFGPFAGTIDQQSAERLVVVAPAYSPGHGGQHGEVIVWVDVEPTRTDVTWTWEGRSLDELGGPLDAVDEAIGLGSWQAPAGDPDDPVDQAVAAGNATDDGPQTHTVIGEDVDVDGFEPNTLPAEGGWITVRGSGFVHAERVTIGGDLECPSWELVSDTELRALVPAYPGRTTGTSFGPTVWRGQHGAGGTHGSILYWQVGSAYERILDPDERYNHHIVIQSVTGQHQGSVQGGEEVVITGAGAGKGVSSVAIGPWFRIDDFQADGDAVRFRAPAWDASGYELNAGEAPPPATISVNYRTDDQVPISLPVGADLTWGGQTPAQLLGPQGN